MEWVCCATLGRQCYSICLLSLARPNFRRAPPVLQGVYSAQGIYMCRMVGGLVQLGDASLSALLLDWGVRLTAVQFNLCTGQCFVPTLQQV
jgi:hypothetical protein